MVEQRENRASKDERQSQDIDAQDVAQATVEGLSENTGATEREGEESSE